MDYENWMLLFFFFTGLQTWKFNQGLKSLWLWVNLVRQDRRKNFTGRLKWNKFWDYRQLRQSELSKQIETNLQKSDRPQGPEWPHRTLRVWRGRSSPCSQATRSGAWGLCEWCHWHGSISKHPGFVSDNGCKKHYSLSDMQG